MTSRRPQVGDRVPPFTVVGSAGEAIDSAQLLADGPVAIHFHIFDFTGSPEGG